MDRYLEDLLTQNPPADLRDPERRRLATESCPDLFAWVYLKHHLRGPDTGEAITFGEVHEDWYRHMKTWVRPVRHAREWRHAYVAPRNSAKSTMWYLIAPLWAAAHGHAKFIAAFSDTPGQAETHLATVRHELDTNAMLRSDFPDLCTPAKRTTGTTVSDNRAMLHTKSGFIMAAKGINSASLGLKVGERRPDVLLLDDIEKGEENYSEYQAAQRLTTLQDVILPLNEFARVVLVGTVTMPGSLIHQMVKGERDWVAEERFAVHYYPAIITAEDGSQRSIWDAKWSIQELLARQRERSFAKNFMNMPIGYDGEYWSIEDITHESMPPEAAARTVISVDPRVVDKKTSDYSGVAVLSQAARGEKVYVRYAAEVPATGRVLRARIEGLLSRFPETRVLIVETNQGGDLWHDVFRGLPVKLRTTWAGGHKYVRAASLLEQYQTRISRVVHADDWDDSGLIEQLTSYPKVAHDDLIDSVGAGARYLTGAEKTRLVVAVA